MIRGTIPNTPKLSDIEKQVKDILSTGWVSNHVYTEQLENEVKKFLKVKHVVTLNSCTTGLILGIKALGLPKKSKIVVPSYTFSATGHAIMWNNLKPYFVDCETDSFVLEKIEPPYQKIEAICGVNIFGNPCRNDVLKDLAEENNVPLYFDSAHAFGSEFKGKRIGGFGDFEVFSLAPTKIMFGIEGGLLATNNEEIADFVRAGKNYGHYGDYNCKFNGLSSRFPEFNAIVALHTLKNMKKNLKRRQEISNIYHKELGELDEISFQRMNGDPVSNNYFGIIIDPDNRKCQRDALFDYMTKSCNIEVKKYFDPCLHTEDVFKKCSIHVGLPNTESIMKNNLTLPMYERLSNNLVYKICNSVKECF